MSIGISLLVHANLDRAEQLARRLLAAGCRVAVHVDAKVSDTELAPFKTALGDLDHLDFAPRRSCEWGEFSLVQAQLATARHLLDAHPDITHVVQLSGSCLPTRPITEFQQFLEKYADTDFIESTLAGGANWIKGGLEAERFTLYFPFSWTRQRRRFDAFVELQRKLKYSRKIPDGLVPHIGSQWWALTRQTLLAILDDPQRPEYDRFFAKSWIPDESYFQTTARKHSRKIVSRSLTFNRFDFQGKPMVFYDDHLRYLGHLSGYFVRKIWPGADKLYEKLLAPDYAPGPRSHDKREAFHAMITQSESRRTIGRAGLVMQSCAPKPSKRSTARPYLVLEGFDRIFARIGQWFEGQTHIPLHGHLYGKTGVNFAHGDKVHTGNQSNSAKIRDYNPIGFLISFLWNNRHNKTAFRFHSSGNRHIAQFIADDPNAHIIHIQSTWVLEMMRENITEPAEIRSRVQAYVASENRRRKDLANARAQVHLVSLADALANPAQVLEMVIADIRPDLSHQPRELPEFLPHDGLEDYLQLLRNNGMKLDIDIKKPHLLPGTSLDARPRPMAE